jgi:hypothetical protein
MQAKREKKETFSMLPICSLCVLCLHFVPTVLKFIFILSDRKAGGKAVPPCLLGVRRGTRYIESPDPEQAAECAGLSAGSESRLRTEVRD